MRKAGAGVIAGIFVAVTAWGCADADANATGAGAQAATGTRTVTGQVVCLVCYARNNANVGSDHDSGRVCAEACVKGEGNPVGIVATDGKVYQFAGGLVANNNAKAAQHVAHKVTVTGEVYEKDGMTMIRADDLKMAQ
jgi:hypothetical protein